jgi:hypothetical protein
MPFRLPIQNKSNRVSQVIPVKPNTHNTPSFSFTKVTVKWQYRANALSPCAYQMSPESANAIAAHLYLESIKLGTQETRRREYDAAASKVRLSIEFCSSK